MATARSIATASEVVSCSSLTYRHVKDKQSNSRVFESFMLKYASGNGLGLFTMFTVLLRKLVGTLRHCMPYHALRACVRSGVLL